MVQGQRILPGVAYLEMARAAVEQAAGVEAEGIRLKNVVWLRPLAVGAEPMPVNIGLYPEANGAIAYEIYSGVGAEQIYSQGSAELGALGEAGSLDLEAIQKRCQTRLEAGEIYERFKGVGLEYGPGQQGIEELYAGTGEVLAKLPDSGEYRLHPGTVRAPPEHYGRGSAGRDRIDDASGK